LFPRADGGRWLQAWLDVVFKLDVGGTANVEGIWGAHSFLNQSLSGTMTRLFSEPAVDGTFVEHGVVLADLGTAGVKAVTIGFFVLVLGLLTLATFAGRRADRSAAHPAQMLRLVAMGEVAAFACGMLLLSPQSSKAHFCVWLFPAAFLADRLLRGPRDRWLWPLVLAAVVCGPLASKGIVGREIGNRLLAYGNVTWCTVLLLLATVRALWTTSRRT
jgi:hypothetical protein